MVKLTLSPLMTSERARARKVILQSIAGEKCSLYSKICRIYEPRSYFIQKYYTGIAKLFTPTKHLSIEEAIL